MKTSNQAQRLLENFMPSHITWGRLKAFEHAPKNAEHLCILLHGYGANAADLYPLHQMIRLPKNTHWILPEGPLDLDMAWSRAWFPIDAQALQRAIESGGFRDFSQSPPDGFTEASDLLLECLEPIKKNYIDITIAGFSQGAMLATDLALRCSEVSRLIAFSANLVARTRTQELAHKRLPRLKFFQSHGQYDPILSFDSAKELHSILVQEQHVGEFYAFTGGHEIPQICLERVNDWIKKK